MILVNDTMFSRKFTKYRVYEKFVNQIRGVIDDFPLIARVAMPESKLCSVIGFVEPGSIWSLTIIDWNQVGFVFN